MVSGITTADQAGNQPMLTPDVNAENVSIACLRHMTRVVAFLYRRSDGSSSVSLSDLRMLLLPVLSTKTRTTCQYRSGS